MIYHVTGYKRGVPSGVYIVSLHGHYVSVPVAVAWLQMAEAAMRDGVHLRINSGFRTMEAQTQLWRERQDPAVRAVKGKAARPGHSKHQSGDAIDTGPPSARPWLARNAAKYGFRQTIKSEPWHLVLVK